MDKKHTYQQSVLNLARKDFTALNKNLTVNEVLHKIRKEGVGERIVYFYVVDDENRLVGVLPTRRILTAPLEKKIEEIMVNKVAALPSNSTVYDACEFFVTYKFLALPIINKNQQLIGVVDANVFTEEMLNLEPDIDERRLVNDIFETIGFNINQIKNASPLKAWKIRLPWLFTTIISGTICAAFAVLFERTLAESLIIAFFLTLVLGLGESVGVQSMTLTVQALHTVSPSFKWYLKYLLKELKTSLLLGISCSVLVVIIIFIWKGTALAGLAIGLSILLIELQAALWGVSVPTILHKTKLDPKISAGPVTLALTDICTILFYFGMATLLL
ncbi:magnesium transporter [Melioribacteraceae bacterium 4301-Me]|uniref:magnesium transporter n=1 Tax=Pyranulibacter aquaticus TaxID=3163344 RepID=UPI0035971945